MLYSSAVKEPDPIIVAKGEEIYKANCMVCHGEIAGFVYKNVPAETSVVWGHGMTNKNVQGGSQHHSTDLRINIAGSANGAFRQGINVNANGAHLSNLWLTLLQAYGVNANGFGASNGTISGLRA